MTDLITALTKLQEFIESGNDIAIYNYGTIAKTWTVTLKVSRNETYDANQLKFEGKSADFVEAVTDAFEEMHKILAPEFIRERCTPPLLAAPVPPGECIPSDVDAIPF